MAKKTTHVIANLDGGWSVKRGGATRAAKRFAKQRDAIAYARQICLDEESEFVLHRRDGTIQSWESYARDPQPRRDASH